MANHNEVAHNWAHQTGRAKRGFNMFYEDRTIYSYGRHFPIARHLETPDGESAILFTTRSYSVSTTKHISYTERAIPAGVPVYDVHDPTAKTKADHKINYRHLLSEREDMLKRASRARGRKAYYLTAADGLRAQANEYSKVFRLGFRTIARPADIDEQLAQIAESEKLQAKRQAEKDANAIRKWLKGEADTAPHTRTPYLRVKGDQLQTSWGIRVPLKRALAIFRLAKICARRGYGYTPVKRQPVGGWVVDKITETGDIRAGCHIIPMRIQVIAAQNAGVA